MTVLPETALTEVSPDFKTWHRHLVGEFSERGILFDTGKLAISPITAPRHQVDRWIADYQDLVALCRRIAREYRHSESRPRDDHAALVDLFHDRPPTPPISRPDGIIVEGQMKFLELNIDSGIGGVPEISLLQSIVSRNPANQDASATYACPRQAWLDYMRDLQHAAEERFSTPVKLAFVGYSDFTQYNIDQCHTFAEWINEGTGIEATVVFPEEIRAGEFATDGLTDFHIVYRYATLVAPPRRAAPMLGMLQAISGTRSMVVSDPSDLLIEQKGILALLWEAAEAGALSERERDLVGRCVPWSRFVRPGTVRFRDLEHDLASLLIEARPELVLKKCFSFQGESVFIGAETDRAVWAELVKTALSDTIPWIIQENLSSEFWDFEYFSPETGLFRKKQRFTASPYFFGSHFGGMLIRTEQDPANRVLAMPTNPNMGLAAFAIR